MQASGAELVEVALKGRDVTMSSMQWGSAPKKLDLQRRIDLKAGHIYQYDRVLAAVLQHHT